MLVCALFCAPCTRDRGCSVHPAFPASSLFPEGERYLQASGSSVPRDRESVSGCHRPAGRPGIPEAPMTEAKGRSVLAASPEPVIGLAAGETRWRRMTFSRPAEGLQHALMRLRRLCIGRK